MLRQLLKHREALLGAVIFLMMLAIGSRVPSFIAPGNLVEMFNDTSILIILALGQMMVLLTKGIDLSMAANLALTGVIVALINFHYPSVPVWMLLLLATAFGLLMGMINGLLVWKLGIPAIVVTLGTMSIYRGIIFLLSGGGWVNSNQMGADFLGLPRTAVLGLPVLSWCAVAALLVVSYFLRYSRTGRALYTAGGNATAAYYTGINAGKMQFVSFCLSGALAGSCGYLWISRFAVAYVDVANGFELQVVAACVIGGISTMGGVYNKFQEDGLVLDERRRADVVAIDINSRMGPFGTTYTGEWAWVFVDVPATYTQQYGSRQEGGFLDIVQPVKQGRILGFERSVFNLAVRLEYVDHNVGTFRETGGDIGDEVWAIVPAISFRPVPETVIRLNYRHQRSRDLLGNPPSITGGFQFGVASYF